jgi:hypothetical protein
VESALSVSACGPITRGYTGNHGLLYLSGYCLTVRIDDRAGPDLDYYRNRE